MVYKQYLPYWQYYSIVLLSDIFFPITTRVTKHQIHICTLFDYFFCISSSNATFFFYSQLISDYFLIFNNYLTNHVLPAGDYALLFTAA